MEDKNIKYNCSCSPFGCLGLIVTVFILFHLGDIWRLLNKGLSYLLNL